MSGKGKCSRMVNNESSDEDSDEVAGRGLTPENIWDGRVVVDRFQVEAFDQDMLRVLLESEWLSSKIRTILDEGFDDGSRRLTHEAALRIADVLTPRHQEVSRLQAMYERRVTTCPLCMISMGAQVVAFRHLASEQHLLQVQRHHELRGWVKKVVPALYSTCCCPHHSSCTCLVSVIHHDHGPSSLTRTRCCMPTSQSIAGIRLRWPKMDVPVNVHGTLSGKSKFSCGGCRSIDIRMSVVMIPILNQHRDEKDRNCLRLWR
jgi:hypothetical protein